MSKVVRGYNGDRYLSETGNVFVAGQESDPDVLAAVIGKKPENLTVRLGLGGVGLKLMKKERPGNPSMYVVESTHKLHAHDFDMARGAIVEDLSFRDKQLLLTWCVRRGVSPAISRPYSIIDIYSEGALAVIPTLASNPNLVIVDASGECIDDPSIDPQNYDPHRFTPKEVILPEAAEFYASFQ